MGLALALLFWILDRRTARQLPGPTFNAVLLAACGIFAFQILSLIIHAIQSAAPWTFIRLGFEKETKDVMLLGMAFWVFAVTEATERRDRIFYLLRIATIILIVSGLLALLSKWRLNNIPWHMVHGWEGTAANRYQHHAGTFFAGTPLMFHIYIPVGFLHSHLAFGALLMFVLPVFMFRFLDPIVETPRDLLKSKTALAGVALLLASIVFLINNARSAMIGTIFGLGLGLYVFARYYWKGKSIRVAVPIAIGMIAFLTLIAFAEHLHERLYSLVISLTGQEKHTDYQRVLLWNATFDLIRDNWLLGVAPGHFQSSIDAILLKSSQSNSALWYANETLQRGHAHSDVLHFIAIAGIPCLLSYLAFFTLLIRRVVQKSERQFEAWKFGAAGLLVAGLYQCYFQDDAVMLPFWILVGLILRITESKPVDAAS